MSLSTDDGWRNWLDCPRCGAPLTVVVDDERAWPRDDEDDVLVRDLADDTLAEVQP